MSIVSFFNSFFKQKHIKKWQIAFWLNVALLLYLTLMPALNLQVSYRNSDKFFHFIGFGAFAFFCWLAFPKLKAFWVVVISSLLGISVEGIQAILPHRSFSYADMVANFSGIVTVVLFLYWSKKKWLLYTDEIR